MYRYHCNILQYCDIELIKLEHEENEINHPTLYYNLICEVNRRDSIMFAAVWMRVKATSKGEVHSISSHSENRQLNNINNHALKKSVIYNRNSDVYI